MNKTEMLTRKSICYKFTKEGYLYLYKNNISSCREEIIEYVKKDLITELITEYDINLTNICSRLIIPQVYIEINKINAGDYISFIYITKIGENECNNCIEFEKCKEKDIMNFGGNCKCFIPKKTFYIRFD